jgi:hypothetical protein
MIGALDAEALKAFCLELERLFLALFLSSLEGGAGGFVRGPVGHLMVWRAIRNNLADAAVEDSAAFHDNTTIGTLVF